VIPRFRQGRVRAKAVCAAPTNCCVSPNSNPARAWVAKLHQRIEKPGDGYVPLRPVFSTVLSGATNPMGRPKPEIDFASAPISGEMRLFFNENKPAGAATARLHTVHTQKRTNRLRKG